MAKVSYRKAGIDVSGLRESAGAQGSLLLLHSLILAQFLLVPCGVEGPLHADSLFEWDSGFISYLGLGLPLSAQSKVLPPHTALCPQAQSASVFHLCPQITLILNGRAYGLPVRISASSAQGDTR